MISFRALAALGAALLCACAHVSAPDQGGSPWFRLTSEHFVLLTDLPRERTEAAIHELEQRRAAVLAAAWDGWPAPAGRLEVIEFRDRGELGEFGPGRDIGGYVATGPFGDLSLVVTGEDSPDRIRGLQYLLGVDIAFAQLGRAPSWLVHGLGGYLSTLRIDEARGVMVLGEADEDLLAGAGNPRPRPGERTMAYHFGRARAGGWERVHYLFTERAEQFNEYLNRLHRGEEPTSAFRAAFPGLEPEFGNTVRDYSRTILYSGRIKVATAPLPRWSGTVAVDELPPSDVHAMFARLYATRGVAANSWQRSRAEDEVQAALRLDPDAISALVLGPLWTMDPARRVERLQALARSKPHDYRVPLLLGRELPAGSGAREQAFRDSIAIGPDEPLPLAALSDELRGRDPVEALSLASKAVRLSSWHPDVLSSEAAALAATGRCDQAAAARDRVFDLFEGKDSAPLAARTRRTLDQVSNFCPGLHSEHSSADVDAHRGG
jgi:hypothetical protein